LESPLLEFKVGADETKEKGCSQTPVSNNYAAMPSNGNLELLFGLEAERDSSGLKRSSVCEEHRMHIENFNRHTWN